MKYIFHFLLTAFGIFFIARYILVDDILLTNGYTSALIFAVILSVVNLILWTILRIVTFPIRLITLWAFSIVILSVIVAITDSLVPTVTLYGVVPILAVAWIATLANLIMKIVFSR